MWSQNGAIFVPRGYSRFLTSGRQDNHPSLKDGNVHVYSPPDPNRAAVDPSTNVVMTAAAPTHPGDTPRPAAGGPARTVGNASHNLVIGEPELNNDTGNWFVFSGELRHLTMGLSESLSVHGPAANVVGGDGALTRCVFRIGRGEIHLYQVDEPTRSHHGAIALRRGRPHRSRR
jgi:hypothetical protein